MTTNPAHQRRPRVRIKMVELGQQGWIARNPWTGAVVSESLPTQRKAYAAAWASDRPPHRCIRCGEGDPAKFGRKGGALRATCRACTTKENAESRLRNKAADPEGYSRRENQRSRESRARRSPEQSTYLNRKSRLKTKYGMTLADFDTLLLRQNGVCAICLGTPGRGRHWHIDHDHATGAVRGILCNGCNTGLGSFRDSAANLTRAAAYLTGGLTK